MIPCPEPGIHKNVPESDYHLWDAVNASLLKTVDKQGPAQAYYERLHPKEPTPAMQFGIRCHSFLLEAERIPELYAEPLNLPRRKDVDKAAHAEYEKEHAGKDFLKSEQFTEHQAMAARMHYHPEWAEMWHNKIAVEISVVWDDPRTGMRCKARIDLLAKFMGRTVVVDYKTTADASAWKFAADMHTFRYALQAAHYLAGVEALAPGHDRSFIFAAQEKKPIYDKMLHGIGPLSMESGTRAWRRALDRWHACVEADEYPGYPTGIGEIEMPSYAIDLID